VFNASLTWYRRDFGTQFSCY